MFTEENLDIVERLNQFAESRRHTILELAFSWLAAKNVIATVIAGASSPEQVKANAVAVNWKLTPAELVKIDRILTSC